MRRTPQPGRRPGFLARARSETARGYRAASGPGSAARRERERAEALAAARDDDEPTYLQPPTRSGCLLLLGMCLLSAAIVLGLIGFLIAVIT